MDQTEKPDLIDRNHAIRVIQKLIDARCDCHRSAIIEKQALRLAQEVLRQLPSLGEGDKP